MIMSETYKGVGSNPFIAFRWSKASGEIYGRGPAINALSAIKTCNLTIELILENAQMAISGIYQIDDDGVINVDTINLRARNCHSKSTKHSRSTANKISRFI